jgi:hypothetical protein
MIGRRGESRDFFIDAITLRDGYGLLSEEGHPRIGALSGNFPRTYPMVGLTLNAI